MWSIFGAFKDINEASPLKMARHVEELAKVSDAPVKPDLIAADFDPLGDLIYVEPFRMSSKQR
jgi:hypothetical protein